MTLFLLLSLALSSPAAAACHPAPELSLSGLEDEAYDERLKAAGKDPQLLWDLYIWCESTERTRAGKSVLRKLIQAEPDHKEARELLGHQWYDGQWFTSEKQLETFKKKEEERIAKERGWVKSKFGWVDPKDLAFLEKGLVRSVETGQWMTPEEIERIAKGWVRQDLEWVAPEEVATMESGMWKVDGTWFDLERANEYHAKLGRYWVIPFDKLLLYTTTRRETALRALDEMERGMRDMKRLFGVEPPTPLKVALLRNQEQYDRFALGDPEREHEPTHHGRLFEIHRAFLAESWFVADGKDFEYRGMGAGYWDADTENGDSFGVHAARLAMGISYVDAIDPSPKALEKALKNGPGSGFADEYMAEKLLPAWLRYGAAVYAERFFRDTTIERGGDPWWARKWSIETIKSEGGLRSVSQILNFPFSANDRVDAKKLMTEAGLLVAFMLDADGQPLKKEYEAFKTALMKGDLKAKQITTLEKALENHEAAIRAFAGL